MAKSDWVLPALLVGGGYLIYQKVGGLGGLAGTVEGAGDLIQSVPGSIAGGVSSGISSAGETISGGVSDLLGGGGSSTSTIDESQLDPEQLVWLEEQRAHRDSLWPFG